MSARELIKQVAALPPQERTLFLQLLDDVKSTPQSAAAGARQNWPDFGERLRGIYGDKVAPDSQQLIDDGSGDR